MQKNICIHGHFYQPPRENPWLEEIQIQDSAHPYHDWNERVTAECYAPNTAARIMDGELHISDIVNNYTKMSFNFGPTLLSWMEHDAGLVYKAIREADRLSTELRSGHGSALAQAYNHLIMPLANKRDKRTQIIWGIRDFEHRFKRKPEGMWLPETGVDLETLDLMAEQDILFTILAPNQASRVRSFAQALPETGVESRLAFGKWEDVSHSRIDPTRPYHCSLPSGRHIALFFYDGPISRAVAFEKVLERGENLVNRLMGGFRDSRKSDQLVHIATDGETYGHHQRFGDMALAYALHTIETGKGATLTNYGEYLEKHPPVYEVEIFDNSSWSCAHGIERWRSNCGCSSGGRLDWNQEWRGPLRAALDWLRDELALRYEERAQEFLKDPWKARDEYISIILNRSPENTSVFLQNQQVHELRSDQEIEILKLLEMQRHAMLMYTSCGWFFDELSGIETVQVIEYAGRALQLSEDLFGSGLEKGFLERLEKAKSNIGDHGDGARIYKKWVKPAMIDLKKVGIHYALSSLFEEYPEESRIYAFDVKRLEYQRRDAGKTSLALGNALITSAITRESEHISFAVLHMGGHALNGGVGSFRGEKPYHVMAEEIMAAFEQASFADVVRIMDKHFGTNSYSLRDLFKDEQRRILNSVISSTLDEFTATYRDMYEHSNVLMGFLSDTGNPLPQAFRTAAEFTLNANLLKALSEDPMDLKEVEHNMKDIRRWNLTLAFTDVEIVIRKRLESMMDDLTKNPSNLPLFRKIEQTLRPLQALFKGINYWQIQNSYIVMVRSIYSSLQDRASQSDEEARTVLELLHRLGHLLGFNMNRVLSQLILIPRESAA